MDATPLRERAQGRWLDILPLCGVDAKFLVNRHGPCPICKGGKDRFRFDDKDGHGSFFCSQCDPNAGSGVDLVMRVRGWDFKTAAQEIEKHLPSSNRRDPVPRKTPEDARAANRDLWGRSQAVVENDPVWRWLNRRCGIKGLPDADFLRFVPGLKYPEPPYSKHPAMIARVTAADGKTNLLHRTYLTADGGKAPVEKCRCLMPGTFPRGGAVRLMAHDETLGISEGIETAYAAALLFGTPVWSAINRAGLENWLPPSGVTSVVIFADNDENFSGLASAAKLATRLKTVGGIPNVTIQAPDCAGTDWNDVLLARKGAA